MKPPMFAYTFHFSVDVGGLIPSLGEVLSEVNRHMADFGFNEGKLTARNEALTATVSPLPKLEQADLNKISELLLADLRKFRPSFDDLQGLVPFDDRALPMSRDEEYEQDIEADEDYDEGEQ